jgi:hypothetical protein
LLPGRAPFDQRPGAGSGQGIDPPLPSVVGGGPSALEQAGLLKPMQRGVDRALGQIERAATAPFDLFDDRVTMRRYQAGHTMRFVK